MRKHMFSCKKGLWVLLTALLLSSLFGCGKKKTDIQEAVGIDEITGKEKSMASFSALVPEGWMAVEFDEPDNLQIVHTDDSTSITDKTPAVLIQMTGDGVTQEDIDAQLKSIKETYDGESGDDIRIAGVDFSSVAYTYEDVSHVVDLAVSDGKQVHIELMNLENDDVEAQAILKSIKFL